MVFSSSVFLFLFLPVLLVLHWLSPRPLRNLLLLTASLLFYLWGEKEYIIVLLASIALNYALGLWMDRPATLPGRRRVVALAVVLNLGLLAAFKYADFLIDNLNVACALLQLPALPIPRIHLPLGISFFTFHALSYVIDIYRGEVRPMKNPITFALYISFFPQSIAGPIVRYRDLAGQLVQRTIGSAEFAEGVRRFIFGLAKKMLIANTLAGPADAIFQMPLDSLTRGLVWLGTVCYTLQIYFDFSGYSDMAIGLARMFGFTFRENFNYPYISCSITEFWRRWHLSLSTWFRDYLYIPLGGNRRGSWRTYANLLTVFFLCGLWHGASWTFIVWGLYHGGFLVLERLGLGRLLEKVPAPLRLAYTLFVVMIGWVFFRAADIFHALVYLVVLSGLAAGNGVTYSPAVYLDSDVVLALIAGILCSTPLLPLLQRFPTSRIGAALKRKGLTSIWEVVSCTVSLAMQATLLLASAAMLASGTHNPFIYFRF